METETATFEQIIRHVADPAPLRTTEQAARYLSVSPHTIRKWAAQGRLRRVKIGALTRYRRADLDRIAARGLPQLGERMARESA
jgi:excisionase family DNA binding protein